MKCVRKVPIVSLKILELMGLQKTTYNQSATQRGLEKQPAIPMLYQLLGQLSSTQDALRCLLWLIDLGL